MATHRIERASASPQHRGSASVRDSLHQDVEQLVYDLGDARHGGVLVTRADLARAKQQLRREALDRLGLSRDRTDVHVPATAFILDKWIELPRTERSNGSAGRWVAYANDYTEALDAVTADPFGVWRLRCDTSRRDREA